MEKYARFFYQPCLPLGNDGKCVTSSENHLYLARRAAADGIVLLKNESGALPLKNGESVALFGKAVLEYVKGGGGSGDVNCPYIHNVFDGFSEKEREGKIKVYKPLVDFYSEYLLRERCNVLSQKQINSIWDVVNAMEFCQKRDDMTYDTFQRMYVKEPDVPFEIIKNASENCDTAVIVISRFSAEGTDRRPVGGDYYLSDNEIQLINNVSFMFKKVIAVFNTGAVTDCELLAENSHIQGILYSWQAGMEGGLAIADVLCGDVNPSGKLPDTVLKSYDYYPSKNDFSESFEYVNYTEDIYVGYRYFETVPGMFEHVRYPFGFGLSYTKFNVSGIVCGESDGIITLAFNVTNTGKCCGREVVQIYFSAPCGKLGKPARQLISFKKSRLLSPGETETCAVSFKVSDMASYDDTGKVSKSSYVLEKGLYAFYVGTDVHSASKISFEYSVPEDIVIEKLREFCKPCKLKKRLLNDGTYELLETTDKVSYCYGEPECSDYCYSSTEIPFSSVGIDISLDDFVNQFTPEELKSFVGGQNPTGVANTGCFGGLPRLKVPAVPTADGPAGLRLNTETGILTTAFPCATSLAATWDLELVYEVGAAAASEIRENNIGIWLAPAINIHRNPLCGRNFEYMSEDPVLAGNVAAAEINGIQSQKVAVSLKHFACNNKEANRFASDSRVSERALREIYLKCFEIAVKKADPWTVMSSYNLINGQHTSESYELLTGILRKEWGFNGMVTTDWGQKNNPVLEVRAGNDMKMHVGYPDDLQNGIEDGVITLNHLKLCTMRILEMMMKLD